jgi:hypothetical protein
MVALVLANAVLEKFGGDTLVEIEAAGRHYARTMQERLVPAAQRA